MSTTSCAGTPSWSRRNPRVPNIGLVKDCVAIAPTPLIACGQRAPIANAFVVTATPRIPVAASRATIDHVIVAARSRRRRETRPCPALDGGGDQAVDLETIADELEDAQLFLARLAVGRGDVTSQGIGGLTQPTGQRGFDFLQDLLQPVLAGEQRCALAERLG